MGRPQARQGLLGSAALLPRKVLEGVGMEAAGRGAIVTIRRHLCFKKEKCGQQIRRIEVKSASLSFHSTHSMPSPLRKTQPLHRSGAVARMLDMPVATLRVWERRYALTDAPLSPGGQRLYTAGDVQRLALMRQLTTRGHAIGQLAGLGLSELQRVAGTHAEARATTRPEPAAPAPTAWRLAVVGTALGDRLQRPALLRALGRPLQLLGPFDSLEQAASALRQGPPPDAWLLHQPELQADALPAWRAALQAPGRRARNAMTLAPLAVLFGLATETACEALAAEGVALLREPQPDAALAGWLRLWSDGSTASATSSAAPTPPPRRWADDDVARFAARPTTVACECPRHVAELLLQLSRFEAYSARCAQRNRADGELHAHLGQVAADARARFEGALERVALHEGLLLPPPTA
ncbi:MAG: hypothetical protein RJA10_374 [Pseudomonadota bacterium]